MSDFVKSVLSLLGEKNNQVATLNVPLNFFLSIPKGNFLGKFMVSLSLHRTYKFVCKRKEFQKGRYTSLVHNVD